MMTYTVAFYEGNANRTAIDKTFTDQFSAIYDARMIRDAYGFNTDVMNNETGVIIAIFRTHDNDYIDKNEIEEDARKIATLAR